MAGGRRLETLTALRWFAALLVLGRHLPIGGGPELLRAGTVGVSFFFVLSGFVLAWSHSTSTTAWTFYRRRAARVVPAYLAVWLIVEATALAQGGPFQSRVLPSLVLLQAWVPDVDVFYGVLPVFWSLSTEVAFYAVAPALFALLARCGARRRWMAAGACVAFTVAWAALLDPPDEVGTRYWLLVIFPPARLVEFALGAILAMNLERIRRVPFVPAIGLAVTAVVVAGWAGPFMWVAMTVVPFSVLIVSAAQEARAGRVTPAALVHLGAWSYGFYLVHVFVLGQVGRHLDLDTIGASVLVLVLSIAAAAALHLVVEVPAERRLRGSVGAVEQVGSEAHQAT